MNWWDVYKSTAHPDYLEMVSHEQAASEIMQYQSLHVPGLLQTPDYAREVLSFQNAPARAELLLELRMRRQALLSGAACPKMSVVLDEFVLKRGRPETLRYQLDHLRMFTAIYPVQVRVIPAMLLAADPPFMVIEPGGFVFAEMADGGNSGGDADRTRWLFGEKWDMAVPLEEYLRA